MSFLLYVVAFIILVIGAPALFVPKKFVKVVGGIVKNSDLVRLYGLWMMLVAFFLLAAYPLLDGSWYMLVAILGWLTLVKSLVALWFPGYVSKKCQWRFASKVGILFMGILSIVMAAFLVWVGLMKF